MGVFQNKVRRVEAWETEDGTHMVLCREDGALARMPKDEFLAEFEKVADRRLVDRRQTKARVKGGLGNRRHGVEQRTGDKDKAAKVDRAKKAYELTGNVSDASRAGEVSWGTADNWRKKFGWKAPQEQKPVSVSLRRNASEEQEARDSNPSTYRGPLD